MTHKLNAGGSEALRELSDELHLPQAHDQQNPSRQLSSKQVAREIFKRRVVRRKELKHIVPLSDTTIYELEQKGDFPKRFYLTPRCVVWSLSEVLGWVDARRTAFNNGEIECAPHPD